MTVSVRSVVLCQPKGKDRASYRINHSHKSQILLYDPGGAGAGKVIRNYPLPY